MKILITGGLGLIGRALSTSLIQAGHEVIIVDNLSTQIHGDLPQIAPMPGAKIIRMDVRALSEHPEVVDGCAAVYHLAAETGTAQSMYQIANYVDVNEMGTASLLEAIAKCSNRPAQIILTSSRSVYGEGAYLSNEQGGTLVQPHPRTKAQLAAHQWEHTDKDGKALQPIATPEHMGFAPGSIYAATKASQELLLMAASSALGFKATIFRLQNVYGEGQSLQNPYTGIISIFYNRARQGLPISIYEDGNETRDFVHVSDIVSGLQAALHADLPPCQVMNLGTGVPTSVSTLVEVLLDVSSLQTTTKVTGQFRVGDIRHNFADISIATRLLGFQPQISLAEGLGRFSRWAASEPAHEDKLEKATAELSKMGLTN